MNRRAMPLAMTLTTEKIFAEFDGSVARGRALAYGHSYTANPLGCAAARASLDVFREENVLERLEQKIHRLDWLLRPLGELSGVKVRQCGFIAALEVNDERTAGDICQRARDHGLLTRNIRNVIVLMLPLCTTLEQLNRAVLALANAIVGEPEPISR